MFRPDEPDFCRRRTVKEPSTFTQRGVAAITPRVPDGLARIVHIPSTAIPKPIRLRVLTIDQTDVERCRAVVKPCALALQCVATVPVRLSDRLTRFVQFPSSDVLRAVAAGVL